MPPAMQHVKMFDFSLDFLVRLHLIGKMPHICFRVIRIYVEYIHEMGIARHFEVFSQYLVKMYRELESSPSLYLAFLHVI